MTLPSPDDLERRAAALLATWQVPDRSIAVRWNRRLSTSIGRAFVRHGLIELNPHLLGQHPDQIDEVLVHEAAHVAAFRLFGAAADPHGRHWRALMRLAGHRPAVTHELPVRRARRQRDGRPARYLFLRVCDGCGHRAIQRAVRYGRCPGCSRRDSYLVLRAPATAAGRLALERMSLGEARVRCRGSSTGEA